MQSGEAEQAAETGEEANKDQVLHQLKYFYQ